MMAAVGNVGVAKDATTCSAHFAVSASPLLTKTVFVREESFISPSIVKAGHSRKHFCLMCECPAEMVSVQGQCDRAKSITETN